MASELRVNTLKDASGNNSIATSFVAGGSAKLWCHWTNNTSSAGDGTTLDSFNVGTFTDVGNGASRFAFTSNMGNASYAVLTGGMHDGGNTFADVYLDHDATPTTSQFDVDILQPFSGSGVRVDDGLWSVSVNGDLA
jgi:hypothetical protein